MYWQKRFDRENKDADIEAKILEIREEHPNYGYRRIHAHLRRLVEWQPFFGQSNIEHPLE